METVKAGTPPTKSAATPAPTSPNPAHLAKGALRRLAQARLEPTPEHYARAYAEEAGQAPPAADGAAWVALIERLARNLDRGSRQWTVARRKESLQRVLDGSRNDAQRLLQRLQSLLGAWDGDRSDDPAETGLEPEQQTAVAAAGSELPLPPAPASDWPPLVAALEGTVRAGLPADEARAAALAQRLGALADAVAAEGATKDRVAEIASVCERVRRLFAHRHELVEQLGDLCRELTAGLSELSEDESWSRGQCESLQARLEGGVSVCGVRAAAELLAETRLRQQQVLAERRAARDALKGLLHRMISEVGELGEHTGRFQQAVAGHADAIAGADSLESLAGVVREMLDDSRQVQTAVNLTQQRLQQGRDHAVELEARVRELEAELRRLSDEVSTDALTQVANRRGLAMAFEAESARSERAGPQAAPLAVALIDIDNFKKLNDALGHNAGDVALKLLAAAVRERLRPADHLARFGGEEFVVLMPATALEEAQQALSRLQRELTASLFMHDGQDVFVTFSAGVTTWKPGEALPATLERADEALYEAKRTGKNRTCTA